MKFIKVAIIFITIFILTSCNNLIVDELPKDYYIKLNNKEINVYDKIYLKDIIKDTNIKYKDTLINTTKIGNNTYELRFKIKKRNYLYNINYIIKDITNPKIFGGSNKTLNIGYEGNLCNLVMYGDNYDSDPTCTIEGNYDTSKQGSYDIDIIVTDSQGNKANHKINLNIIKQTSSNTNEPKKINKKFNEVYSNYKTDTNKIGIDVSRWQGDIDFNKVKSSGAEFVLIRMGVQTKLNEDVSMDSKFKDNIKKAHEAGLDVGVYIYSIALTTNEAEKHAAWAIDNLDGETLELPIVFDWENWSKWNEYKLSFHQINSIKDKFINTINKSKYKGMLYSSKFYLENIWELNNEPIWLAHYTDKTNYEGKYNIWQLCNTGLIDGINGDVDIDILYN